MRSSSGNAIQITSIHNHGYILPEREKKDKGAEADEKEGKAARNNFLDTAILAYDLVSF